MAFDPRALGAQVGRAARPLFSPAPTPNQPHAAPPPATVSPPATVAPPLAPVETPEERRKRTGVDPGGAQTGPYVSGQVDPRTAPSASAMAAMGVGGAPAAPPPNSGFTGAGMSGSGQPWRVDPDPSGTAARNAAAANAVNALGIVQFPGAPATSTTRSGLTTGDPNATSTTRSAVTNNTGTTPGFSPLPGPVQSGLNQVPIIGPALNNLTTTSAIDLGPTKAAQAAAFGAADALNQERFDYRPGDAASRDSVALDKAAQDEIRARQLTAFGGLRDAATGAVPSAAELQLREQAARNSAAALGAARALGGRSAGGAARAGTLALGDIQARTNVDAATQRAAEQERARALEVQALTGARGQDIDVAGADATLRDRAIGQNLDSQLRQNELADRHRLELLNQRLRALGIGTDAATGGLRAAAENAAAENRAKGGILGGITSRLGL